MPRISVPLFNKGIALKRNIKLFIFFFRLHDADESLRLRREFRILSETRAYASVFTEAEMFPLSEIPLHGQEI